jgi:hypothetical protein
MFVKRISSPIRVTVSMKIEGSTSEQVTSIRGAFEVAKYPLGSSEVSYSGAMQKLAKLIHRVGDIWPSESVVLQGTNNVYRVKDHSGDHQQAE